MKEWPLAKYLEVKLINHQSQCLHGKAAVLQSKNILNLFAQAYIYKLAILKLTM